MQYFICILNIFFVFCREGLIRVWASPIYSRGAPRTLLPAASICYLLSVHTWRTATTIFRYKRKQYLIQYLNIHLYLCTICAQKILMRNVENSKCVLICIFFCRFSLNLVKFCTAFGWKPS